MRLIQIALGSCCLFAMTIIAAHDAPSFNSWTNEYRKMALAGLAQTVRSLSTKRAECLGVEGRIAVAEVPEVSEGGEVVRDVRPYRVAGGGHVT